MRRILELATDDLLPEPGEILAQQGVPAEVDPGAALQRVAESARRELEEGLAGWGVLASVTEPDFATVCAGDGRNAGRMPLESIYPRAGALYLFAATCGAGVSERIAAHFRAGDYPAAAALDAAASLAADRGAAALEHLAGAEHPDLAAVRYSPGYCGWHVSGQRALFAALEPEVIGLRLNESFVMDPLKSVSGVIVIGVPEIHRFAMDFDFCADCTDRSCRARIDSLTS